MTTTRARQTLPRLLQAMLDAFSVPDLRRRLLITLGVLVIFRFVAHVPLPGVDLAKLQELFSNMPLLGMLDMFSGGAMRRFSVAAMGVYPYITASIIMTILVPVIPKLQAISQEGEAGRHKVNLITHWLTIPMAAINGYGELMYLRSQGVIGDTAALSMTAMVIAMIAGTIFCVWLGEMITEYGIGNGISIIIFGGIVAGLPQLIGQGVLAKTNIFGLIFYIIIALATAVLIVYFTEGHRRIPVQYARSVIRGGKMYRQAGSTHIPLRVNTAGMIPLIFAMSLVMFPGIIASYFAAPQGSEPNIATHIMNIFSSTAALPVGFIYWGLYFVLVIGFTFFYTIVLFQQQDLAGTLQKQGGFVPGIRPGAQTKKYMDGVISHITWAGAFFLALVAIMPFIAQEATGIQGIQLSSTGMLIVIGVVLDTMKQLEAQLVMRRYEGFIK